jgi:hypothetical protein
MAQGVQEKYIVHREILVPWLPDDGVGAPKRVGASD